MEEASGGSTKERILAATIELLERDGWDAVTVRGIAAHAEVNLALVNYHFGSKTNLKLAAFDAVLHDAVETPMGAPHEGPDLDGGLRELIHVALGSGRSTGRRRIFESAMAAALHDPDIAARMRPMLERGRAQLAGWIDESVAAGQLPGSTDVAALAVVLTAMLDGLWVQQVIDPATDVDRVVAAVTSLLRSPTG